MNKIEQGVADINVSGMVAQFAMITPPTGWLKCNGALISRSIYPDLFAAIGTVYGVGDGNTTFGLPDLRGEFVRGYDDSRGIDNSRVFGSTQADDFKSHLHSNSRAVNTPYRTTAYASGSDSGLSTGFVALDTGSTGGTETRPKNIALLYCIKY